MTSQPMEAEDTLVCSLAFSSAGFASDWAHCDQISNYVSRVASFGQPDPFAFGNLLSTVLNEILETIYRQHADREGIRLSCYQDKDKTLIVSDIATAANHMRFFTTTVDELGGDVQALYQQEILREGAVSPAIGLYELAANYDAQVEIETRPEAGRVRLKVGVNLVDLLQAAEGSDS